MHNNTYFEKYKKVKKELQYNYKGYPIEKIFAIDLIIEVYHKRIFTIKSLVGSVLKHFLPSYFSVLVLDKLNIKKPNNTLFAMGTYQRKDYYEIWEYVKDHVEDYESFDFSVEKKKFRLNIKNIGRAIAILNKTNEFNFIIKFKLAGKLAFFLNTIDELEKVSPNVGKFCAFSGVHNPILTYYFKKKGIPTYSLQHGLYTVFDKQIPLDAILYENFCSDYHLCWGQSTKDEFEEYGIDSKSLIISGYPRDIKRPSIPRKVNKMKCVVLFARYSFHPTNLKLVDILSDFSKKTGVEISMKLHPSLFWDDYRGIYEDIGRENNWELISEEITLTDLFKSNRYGWSIGVNTGAYYESYIYNIPCLRYNDGSFEDTVDVMQDIFKNRKELSELFKMIPSDDQHEIHKYFKRVDDRLDYTIGINTNAYDILNVG